MALAPMRRASLWSAPVLRHAVGPQATRQQLSSAALKREAFKKKLEDDSRSLDDFILGGSQMPTTPAPVPKKAKPPRPRTADERLPKWLKVPLPAGKEFKKIQQTVRGSGLATVCEEAKCPNIGECWGGHDGVATATIMVMGDTCTRGCRFCAVKTSRAPAALDPREPHNVAKSIKSWGVDYIVITSVDRDDVPDGGADHYAKCVEATKAESPDLLIECLVGDFAGDMNSVDRIVRSPLDVFAHNVETVERCTPFVRDRRATYRQTLAVLERAVQTRPDLPTKSSIMLGCGETDEEIEQTMKDLRNAGVQIVTLGQYLRPTKRHMKVSHYVTPEKFDEWRLRGEAMGFAYVASGPLVRSSYRAGEFFIKSKLQSGGFAPRVVHG